MKKKQKHNLLKIEKFKVSKINYLNQRNVKGGSANFVGDDGTVGRTTSKACVIIND
jgi:hypothetical protein